MSHFMHNRLKPLISHCIVINTMFKVKQINNEFVEPVKFTDQKADKRPVRGANIFSEVYCNIFLCARKKSGKTCGIAKIVEACSTSETRIIVFANTLEKDPTWGEIRKYCSKNDIDFTGFRNIKDLDTKQDILAHIMRDLGEPGGEKETQEKVKSNYNPILVGSGAVKEKKKKKPKELAPEIIFIFDDQSGELQLPSVAKLLKEHRHYKCKTIISSQYWNDIVMQGRKQIDYILLYKGLAKSIPKMRDIYKDIDLTVEFETFMELYSYATAEKYHFLFIDKVNNEFRKDFTHKITVPDEDEEPEQEL